MRSIIENAHKGVQKLNPYRPGKPESEVKREYGLDHVVKLASNENPMGAPASSIKAIEAVLSELARYPDGAGHDLKQALSAYHDIDSKQITLGNGTNELLNMIARLFLVDDASVVFSEHAFIVYKMAAVLTGAKAIEVPAVDYGHDLDAMATAIEESTRLVFLANPNNPTGTYFSADVFEAFMAKVPEGVVVVLDEAYFDYVKHDRALDGVAYLNQFKNLIVTRTFSKAYGLSALRIGYAVSSLELADLLNRAREPFNTNSLAQIAANAALADRKYVDDGVALNNAGMALLQSQFQQMNLSFIESQGNFLAVEVGDGPKVAAALLEKGIIVRPIAEYGLNNFIRVTIGLPEENQQFLDALAEVLAK